MADRRLQKLAALACLAALAGCAVVQSQSAVDVVPVSKGGQQQYTAIANGIPYFLPKRPFVVTVSEPSNGGVPFITIGPGTAEPDLSARYVLSQGTNLLADNEFNITVGTNSLLESSTSTATSEVATTVQNAASTVGFLFPGSGLAAAARMSEVSAAVMAANLATSSPEAASAPLAAGPIVACPVPGTSYQILVYPEIKFDPNKPITLCSDSNSASEKGPYTVTWERADGGNYIFNGQGNNRLAATTRPVSGLFFRHELPYLVKVQGPAVTVQGATGHLSESDYVVSSPDESETDFFPVKRSFFANNTANITMTDGVITGVDQTTKSEVASAVGLPATFISSYMTAVGQLFSGLSVASGNQQKLIQQTLATNATQTQAAAVAAVQNQFCARTLASYNFSTMSGADFASALTAIKAACPAN